MKSRYELIKYFRKLGLTKGAEIGVAGGYFSEIMFKTIPNLHLYCVDAWTPYRGNLWSGSKLRNVNHFKTASKILSKYNSTIIREMSMDAVKKIKDNSLDFVYIDANHSFDYVMQDLIEWSKKVRLGGVISGDDYYHFRKAGVIGAVDAYTKAHGITFNLTDPIPEKVKNQGVLEQPNFWWIKT